VRTVVQHRVRYHEADAQGFLFNSRYLELADVAMTEYFRSLGFPYRELVAAGADPSVVSARLNFARPARFEDILDVRVACTRVGRSSFDLTMAISRNDQTIAEIDLTYVNVDAVDAVSRVLPDRVASALRADSAIGDHRGLEIHQ
jgi:acyl-CoA thioester hydrolase